MKCHLRVSHFSALKMLINLIKYMPDAVHNNGRVTQSRGRRMPKCSGSSSSRPPSTAAASSKQQGSQHSTRTTTTSSDESLLESGKSWHSLYNGQNIHMLASIGFRLNKISTRKEHSPRINFRSDKSQIAINAKVVISDENTRSSTRPPSTTYHTFGSGHRSRRSPSPYSPGALTTTIRPQFFSKLF